MSYTKQSWTTNEILSASKFNHLESGIENNLIIIKIEDDNYNNATVTCSDSFEEIKTALLNGVAVLCYVHSIASNRIHSLCLVQYDHGADQIIINASTDYCFTWDTNGITFTSTILT